MIKIEKLFVSYGKNTVLKDVNINIKKGRVTAIIGTNASGKTTLLNCICSLVPYKGSVYIDGKDIKKMTVRQRAQNVSVLHQHLPSGGIRAEHLVEMGRSAYVSIGKALDSTDREKIAYAIEKTGIGLLRHKTLNELSGGERQKVFLASVLCQDTPVVLFDEPTTYMDKKNEKEFLVLVTELCRQAGKTLVTVMHDITSAVNTADDIIVINGGSVAFCGTSDECVKSGIIEEIFSVEMLSHKGRTVYY